MVRHARALTLFVGTVFVAIAVAGCGGDSPLDGLSARTTTLPSSDADPSGSNTDSDSGDSEPTSDEVTLDTVLASSVVELEAADDPGPAPFTSDVGKLTGSAVATAVRSGAVEATQPGLYGAKRGQAACDSSQLVDELNADPALREAFAVKLAVATTDLGKSVGVMASVVLRSDTLVIDHLFVGGKAVGQAAVLEAGTPVLVDQFGVPRVRCTSGSPLQTLMTLPENVEFKGAEWTGFRAGAVISVVPAAQPIGELVLVDPGTLEAFLRDLPSEEIPLEAEPTDVDLPPTADVDGDGVPDLIELADDSVFSDLDSDGDGVPDAIEAMIGSDPNVADFDVDGDGIPDAYADLFDALPTDIDFDGDGIPDDLAAILDSLPDVDIDGDGVPDDLGDFFTDLPQVDLDGDGVPDDPFTDLTFSDEPPPEEAPIEPPADG